ncbi:hypothetical protein CWE15_03455 [Aliidiomarina taiwanensis]|uniref:Negative regulator of sigma E activity n=1 Tax=Aliidiomarina taiwanensis TaxID=946228 RepID=A0A432XA32_9GAMM|nr:MucB/RseB C-terminal domain-containing protein [Aliidiomarina taiwanensis]RUO44237.1 hypothetical protein CWE15_03455 [Aliidiomarina taiwanensis]
MKPYVVGLLVICSLNVGALQSVAAAEPSALATNTVEPVPTEQESNELQQARAQGEHWFKRMQSALQELNYRASFIAMQPSGLQAYRWVHSVTPAGNNIEVIESLNGPHNQAVRFNNQVAYLSSTSTPYAVASETLSGPIPSGLYGSFETLHHSYHMVAVGGDRVVDRAAQHIRLIPHERDRYLYSLWVDRETGMLLSMNTYLPSGDVVEQILLTSLHVQAESLEEVQQLESQWGQGPSRQPMRQQQTSNEWQFDEVPTGFTVQRQQQVRVAMNGPLAEHFMFTDGMAKFSVYIIENENQVLPVQYENLTSMVSVVHDSFAVTIVGKVPLSMAQAVAAGVRRQP